MPVKIKLNRQAVRQLLKSPEMQAILREEGEKLARQQGGGAVEPHMWPERAAVFVRQGEEREADD